MRSFSVNHIHTTLFEIGDRIAWLRYGRIYTKGVVLATGDHTIEVQADSYLGRFSLTEMEQAEAVLLRKPNQL